MSVPPLSKNAWAPWLAASVFFVFFLAFGTQYYDSVDGALRCLGVFFHGDRFHGNNHMLYPFWVGAWANANALLGNRADNALQYVRHTQWMNSFAMAAVIGFLFYLIQSVANVRAAILGALFFGLSGAVTLEATTSNEPVAGLFFAGLALAVLAFGLRNSNIIATLLAGFFMTVALASYEAMGTVVGPAILMCIYWPAELPIKRVLVIRRLAITAAGCVLGWLVIYGWAYSSQGVPIAKMPARFLSMGGAPDVYTGADLIPGKVANAAFGLLRWSFAAIPDDYAGIRWLLHHPDRVLLLAIVILAFALFAIIALLTIQAWRSMAPPGKAPLLALVAGILIFVTAPVWYWGPLNPKMWLLPLGCIAFAVSVGWARGVLAPRRHQLLTACLLLCVAAEVARNVPPLIHDHSEPSPDFARAAAVARVIRPDDRVMIDFDGVSTTWQAFWGENVNTLLLPASTTASASEWLERAKAAASQEQGRLLFLEILGEDKATWDRFLGARVRIP